MFANIFDEAISNHRSKQPVPVTEEEIAKRKLTTEIFDIVKNFSVSIAEETMVVPEDTEEDKLRKKQNGEKIELLLNLKMASLQTRLLMGLLGVPSRETSDVSLEKFIESSSESPTEAPTETLN